MPANFVIGVTRRPEGYSHICASKKETAAKDWNTGALGDVSAVATSIAPNKKRWTRYFTNYNTAAERLAASERSLKRTVRAAEMSLPKGVRFWAPVAAAGQPKSKADSEGGGGGGGGAAAAAEPVLRIPVRAPSIAASLPSYFGEDEEDDDYDDWEFEAPLPVVEAPAAPAARRRKRTPTQPAEALGDEAFDNGLALVLAWQEVVDTQRAVKFAVVFSYGQRPHASTRLVKFRASEAAVAAQTLCRYADLSLDAKARAWDSMREATARCGVLRASLLEAAAAVPPELARPEASLAAVERFVRESAAEKEKKGDGAAGGAGESKD